MVIFHDYVKLPEDTIIILHGIFVDLGEGSSLISLIVEMFVVFDIAWSLSKIGSV